MEKDKVRITERMERRRKRRTRKERGTRGETRGKKEKHGGKLLATNQTRFHFNHSSIEF